MDSELELRRVVVDSWPVMEWIKRREPARSHFNRLLDAIVAGSSAMEMTRINYGEVIYTIRKTPDLVNREEALRSIDDSLVDEAVELKSQYSFAYADAFAAALAMRLGVPLVTGDVEFRALEAEGLLALEWFGA